MVTLCTRVHFSGMVYDPYCPCHKWQNSLS